MNVRQKQSIFSLVWHSYIKSALLPILVIEIALLAAYFITNTLIRDENVRLTEQTVRDELITLSRQEADLISSQMDNIARLTELLAGQTLDALVTPVQVSEEESSRYEFQDTGAWVTTRDIGGAATFYSSVTDVGEAEMQKAWQLSQLDPLMKRLVELNPLVAQAYFNSHDSLNRIYPYFDVASQYPPDLDIPIYNFYYEADLEHNPGKGAVWTDVYVDPAGQGWMTSAIAPVYNGEFLEGVVGLDVTVQNIINQVLNLQVPWNAYAVLLDRQGTLLALPPAGEQDWGLSELTDHSYEEAIQQDTFKPDQFNIFKREDTQAFATNLSEKGEGLITMQLGGQSKLVAFNAIPGTGWSFAILVDEAEIFREANLLQSRFERVGWLMLAGLVIFYVFFFGYLYHKSGRLSARVAEPLQTLARMIEAIGSGEYRQIGRNFDVVEIQQTSDGLVSMGLKLEESNKALHDARESLEKLNQSLEVRVTERTSELKVANESLESEKAEQQRLIAELHETQAQLVQSEKLASLGQLAAGVAHEINNPLSFISSNVGFLRDYGNELISMIDDFDKLAKSDEMKAECERIKNKHQFDMIIEELPDLITDSVEGVRRVKTIVENLREFSHSGNTEWQDTNINNCIESTLNIAINEIKYKAELIKELSEVPKIQCIPSQINQVILNLLVNAAQAIDESGTLWVRSRTEGDSVVIEVEDTGRGIPEDVMPKIFDPFFTTKDIGEGTGLGLSISYGIISAHHGTISAQSTPGKGTIFRIVLPVAQNAAV